MVEKTVSTTGPDAGMMHRPGKPEGMHYLNHQSIDAANGMIVDVAVTPGDVSDSVPYLERIDYMRNHLGLDIRTAGADTRMVRALSVRRWRIWESRFTHQVSVAARPVRWN